MAQVKNVIDDCDCYDCTLAREKRGGLAREWPLILFCCLLVVSASVGLTLTVCATLNHSGILTLPVGFAVIASGSRWLFHQLRYSPHLRQILLWPGYAVMAAAWFGLSVDAGLRAHQALHSSQESSLASSQEQYQHAVQQWQRRPGWFRLLTREPTPPVALGDAVIDGIALALVLLCLLSPTASYYLLVWEKKKPRKETQT